MKKTTIKYLNKKIELKIIGYFKKTFEIIINENRVALHEFKYNVIPVYRFLAYENDERFEILIIQKNGFFNLSKEIIIINNYVCKGDYNLAKTIISDFRMRLSESKYYNIKHKIKKIFGYTFLNSLIFSFFMSIYFIIISKVHSVEYIPVYFIVYSIMTGILQWNQYSKIDASYIDSIKLDDITENKKNHLTTVST